MWTQLALLNPEFTVLQLSLHRHDREYCNYDHAGQIILRLIGKHLRCDAIPAQANGPSRRPVQRPG
jgi:hypothetical protein